MERVACIIVGCNGADKEYRLNNKRRLTLASFLARFVMSGMLAPMALSGRNDGAGPDSQWFFIQVLKNIDSLVDSGEQCARIPNYLQNWHTGPLMIELSYGYR